VDDGKGNRLDMTDEFTTETLMARKYCRTGLPAWLKDYIHANHPYEDGAITEFNGDMAMARSVLASGGALQTGGTNTSRNSSPFQIGPVGGHEQSAIGGSDSPDARKFMSDKGITVPANDFICIFSQTWGSGFSGEVADKYWWVGTAANGKQYSQEEVNNLRGVSPKDAADLVKGMAGTGWGEKPEGAWMFLWSQVKRCFEGDIFAWLPRVKGFANPTPPPPPGPVPNPPFDGSFWVENGTIIRGDARLSLAQSTQGNFDYTIVPDPANPGKFKFAKKIVI